MNNYFFISLLLLLSSSVAFPMDKEELEKPSPKALHLFNKSADLSDNEPGCPLPDNIGEGCVNCLQIIDNVRVFAPQENTFSRSRNACLDCLKYIPDEPPACGLGATVVILGLIAVKEAALMYDGIKKVKTE